MNEIEKYKKARLLFSLTCVLSAIAVLVYVLIVVLTNSIFNTHCIIAVSIFGGYTLLMLVFFVIFDKRRLRLVEKYFGKVSTEDIEKGKVLIGQVKIVMQGEYSFFESGQFEFDYKSLKYCLKQIVMGHKVYSQFVNVYFDIQKEIENSPEKDLDVNKNFNTYINELTDLFERNKCDF